MRCDVNVSVRKHGAEEMGTKIELKNMNSMSNVRRALKYEIARQISVLESGGTIDQATWRWDDDLEETQMMRSKEDAHDYRYFPDPDLLPVETPDIIERMRPQVPELPHEKRERFVGSYKISDYDASVLASERSLADYFEQAAEGSKSPKKVANWVINNLLSALNETDTPIGDCPLPASALKELVDTIEAGEISNNQGKEVFTDMFATGKGAAEVIKEKGFEPPMNDTGALEAFIDQVIAKSTHHKSNSTIDFNRAGTPLMEIVSEPDIASQTKPSSTSIPSARSSSMVASPMPTWRKAKCVAT